MSKLCLYDAREYLKGTFDFSIFKDILFNTTCVKPLVLVKKTYELPERGYIYYKDKDVNYSMFSIIQDKVKSLLNAEKGSNLIVNLLDNGSTYILTYIVGNERLTIFLDSSSYRNKVVNIIESYTGKKGIFSKKDLYSIVCDTLKVLYPFLDLVQGRHKKIVIEEITILTGISENTCGVGHITSDMFQEFVNYKSNDISLQNKWGDDKLHCEYVITLKSNNMKDRS